MVPASMQELEPAAVAAASQHFTRSQLAGDASFKAAGVLPLCFMRNTPYVLLGAELARTGPKGKVYKTMWCAPAVARCGLTSAAAPLLGWQVRLFHPLVAYVTHCNKAWNSVSAGQAAQV